MAHLRIDRVLGFEHGIPPALGVVVAGFGVIFLVFGWKLHRLTVAFVGFLIGAFIGQLVAKWLQVDRLWGLSIGGGALALLADPLHRVVIFVLAGLAMGVVSGEGARLVSSGGFLWGFLPGFLAGGLLSLWQLRGLVILSTSLFGGLGFLWGGAIGLGWIYRPAATFHLRHPIGTTVIVGLVFLIGCAVQFRFSPVKDPGDEVDEE